MSVHTTVDPSKTVAARLLLSGRVQGIGLRPAVARFAAALNLKGYVTNTREGVEILVEGSRDLVRRFEDGLKGQLPSEADVERFEIRTAGAENRQSFDIIEVDLPGAVAARVPPDMVVCDGCIEEVASPMDRRGGYAFTSCTRCGPRYSIIDSMPYERSASGMARFVLCPRCRQEYTAAEDRRFHAQTNACPDCGPELWCRDQQNRVLGRRAVALEAAVRTICEGRIVAIRGLGGYQLVVDATSESAVEQLRLRKRRPRKPLAVMVASLEAAERLAYLDATERATLKSAAGPIVAVRVRNDALLSREVFPGLDTVGIMLPTTPLHWLLLRGCDRPLVVTSGNREGEPLAIESDAAHRDLRGIADLWLEHDRLIRRAVDDSVVRVMAGRPVTIRLARGLAPLPLELECDEPILAVGGHQKVAIALSGGRQAVLGPHVGDMDTTAGRARWLSHISAMAQLYGAEVSRIACDLHPHYFTTDWAHEQSVPIVEVQHHHAHVAAGMLENGWLDQRVLGVSMDGTGYGTDGTIWGGEFLLSHSADFTRVGHLRPFRLPGGERVVREPWRVAVALVSQAFGAEAAARLEFSAQRPGAARRLLVIVNRDAFSPLTTSAGRLFDGVAALVLGAEQATYEGEPAMLLEAASDPSASGSYPVPLVGDAPKVLDWRPMIERLLADRAAGVSPGVMATRFHRGLAKAIASFCRRFAPMRVVLGGGVFQNRVLTELLAEYLSDGRQPLGFPQRIPPGDGGLAAGQLAIAVARQRTRT